jgi:outer membrane protein assembly factor BamB
MHLLVGAASFFFAAPMRPQNTPPVPKPVPFRSSDGRVTGWKIAIPGERPLASPAIAGGKVFVGGGFGSHEFYAFDAATGRSPSGPPRARTTARLQPLWKTV